MDEFIKQYPYALVIFVAGLLAIILGYFIVTIIRHLRKTAQENQVKIQAEITTLENERRRIAADLHDELGPLLSAVKYQIGNVDAVTEEEQQLLNKSGRHIDEIIQKLRDIAYGLLPNTLIRKGLVKAIEDYIEKLSGVHALVIHFDCTDTIVLSQEREINVYRIVQEIIHNCIKHAEATRLDIILSVHKRNIVLSCKDDGRGFDYESEKSGNSGLGLLNLQSRTDVMNGDFIYGTKEGKGTRYLFKIPIQ
jgi:two-component system, NarL family, sensor kinase